MGVAGCGNSTVAPGLCAALGALAALGDDHHNRVLPPVCIEGDDHHPAANIAKMSRGEPLTDADRQPWLESLAMKMRQATALAGTVEGTRGRDVVLACSALKRAHRATLTAWTVGDTLREVNPKS
jgi:gluconokinase